ncbi:retrovirus-related pol polyprotein from transposon TNT 1-94 [Tanacetum coccineum]|uniref:Retrovirus-related pol polyprotein from transposon TNT 1-94 n=1 Tax=Tanacetum coccineum TaxID=301880 RepID=A0ABQ5F743_9ASTR
MNELVNDGIKLSKLEINTGFINGLPKKWLSFCQSLKNTNHVKDSELASLFGKLKYEENLIDSIYETKKNKSLVSTTLLSTAFISTSLSRTFKISLMMKRKQEAVMSSTVQKQLTKLNATNVARNVILQETAGQKLQFPHINYPFNQNLSIPLSKKPKIRPTKDFEAKYNKVKAKLALLSSSASASKAATIKNKGPIAEAYEWDKEEVSPDDNEIVEVKLLVLKQAKLDFLTMSHVNTEILKENKNLRIELKELTAITETWLNRSYKVNQCISEQIPFQKKRILGVDQLTEDPSSSGQKDLVFVKSSTDNTKVSIPDVQRPWLSEAEGFILPNHDTGRILPAESQRNTTDPSVVVTDSSATEYDSADESLVCSTPLPPLKKLDGAEPTSRSNTIKSILRSKSTFKAEALKGVKINKPSLTPAKGNKSSSASKINLAPGGKLKSEKIKDDPPLVICDIRNPIWYLDSGCSRHMTGVKSYLHKYEEQLGPKVVFGDDSTRVTKGYGSIKCNGIVFTKFDEKRGTIFNSNKEIVMIAPRVRDVYVLDMTSSAQESCFFAKASENLNWLWHKRLAHLNFKTINKLTSSIKKCLHLLHMDLFRPVTPRSINHEKYTLVIVDEYSRNSILVNFCDERWISQNFSSPYTPEQNGVAERKNRTLIEAARTMLSGFVFSKKYWGKVVATRIPNINFLHVFGCPVYIHNHKDHLGKFDEKVDDGYLLGYSLVSKAFRVFNTRRYQTEETYHITFDESPDAIKFSKPSVDNINIAKNKRYPPDEYLHPYEPSQRYQTNNNDVSFIEPYEGPEPVVLESEVSSDQNGQTDQNDQSIQNDEIVDPTP